MNSRELWEALGEVEDRYLNLVDAPSKENYEMKRTLTRKSVTVLVAAVICISILTVTALAAGWIPGIFRALTEKEPAEQPLFEAAAQANANAQPESQQIPYLDYSKFTLFERYYDGETILLGYDMSLMLPEPVVGYTPTPEEMEYIRSYTEFASPEEDKTENIRRIDAHLREILSEEAYQSAMAQMEKDGYICIMTHEVFVGDHIYVNDADIGEVLSEEVGNMRYDYETEEGSCIRLNPLPEAGRNQNSVKVTLKIKSHESYEYFDAEGRTLVFKADNHKEEPMDFVLENTNRA